MFLSVRLEVRSDYLHGMQWGKFPLKIHNLLDMTVIVGGEFYSALYVHRFYCLIRTLNFLWSVLPVVGRIV